MSYPSDFEIHAGKNDFDVVPITPAEPQTAAVKLREMDTTGMKFPGKADERGSSSYVLPGREP